MTDGTPDSYFELAILHILGNEFYVFWHALPGKDVVPIGGKNTLENLSHSPWDCLDTNLRTRNRANSRSGK